MRRSRLPVVGPILAVLRAVLRAPGRSRAGGVGSVLAGALASMILVAACAGWTTSPDLVLGLRNGTGSPVLVYVNDGWVGTVPAGATTERIPSTGHGGPPYRVEVRLANGRVLAALDAPAAGSSSAPAGAAGSPARGGAPESVTTTLPCGVIELAVGGLPAAPPPAPSGGARPPAKACE